MITIKITNGSDDCRDCLEAVRLHEELLSLRGPIDGWVNHAPPEDDAERCKAQPKSIQGIIPAKKDFLYGLFRDKPQDDTRHARRDEKTESPHYCHNACG